MRNHDLAIGVGLAGALLVAMPALDLLLGTGGAGPIHLIAGSSGLAYLTIAVAKARKGIRT